MTNKSMSQSTQEHFIVPLVCWLVVCGALAIFLSPGWAAAQTIWDGDGANNLFSNLDNWNNDIAPPNDGTDTLTLSGSHTRTDTRRGHAVVLRHHHLRCCRQQRILSYCR